MKSKNKYIALLFVVIVLCPIFTLIYFPVKEKILQYQAFEQMETESLEALTVHKSSVVWVRNGKEILYQQALYDVKSIVAIGDSLSMLVLKDTKEMELLAIRDRIYLPWSAEHKFVQEQAQELVWTNEITIISLNFSLEKVVNTLFSTYTSQLESGIKKPCYSPPWIS